MVQKHRSRSSSPKPTSRAAAAAGDANPTKSDPELKGLLKRLDKVKKYKTFNRWKSKFLDRFTTLIFEKGMGPAEKACNDFAGTLNLTIKCATKLTGFIEKGELSSTKKTVKASLCLSELTKDLTLTNEKLEKLIPSLARDEKKLGFTKYHLGAVLIRQGFHQYITMQQIDDALQAIKTKVGDVADRQQLELFDEYKVRLQRFCDIMADLNLYEIMMKCVEFQEAPDPEESSDEEPMMIELEVETPEGKQTIKLEVEPSETIKSIKDAIADDIGIPADKQVIKFKGKELDDGTSLGKAGVTNGSKLTVEPFRVPVTVKTYDGKEIKLMVDPANYLSDIKMMIEPESGIPAPNQELFKDNKKLEDDNKKAEDYGIKAGTVLYMEPKTMNLKVDMPDGTQVEVQVSPSDTTDQVKKKIEEKTGVKVPTQVLKHNGKDMPADKKLKDMGIKDGDTIKCELLQVPVKVTTKDGKVHEIMVAPTDTVKDIKKMLEDKTGVPADQQILTDGSGKVLDNDGATANDVGIQAGSTLTLDAKAMKVTIELPNGTKHVIEIDALDQSKQIEAKLSKTGCSALSLSKGTLQVDTSKVFGK